MVGSNKLYIHFERENYILKKSEFLKAQIDILHLKRKIRDITLLRNKKLHYRKSLDDTIVKLRKNIEKLDELMPLDRQVGKVVEGKNNKKKNNSKSELKKIEKENTTETRDIETELLQIKKKLDSLKFG